MSEPADFLKRWSQRKREAAKRKSEEARAKDEDSVSAKAANTPAALDETGTAVPTNKAPAGAEKAEKTEQQGDSALPFDLSKLPSIDSIGPDTDIRVFMQPGVPASLTRAALRRAWTADPAIRDYIGLSENSWDFTDPEAIPGFGTLAADEAKKLLTNFFSPAPGQSAALEDQPQAVTAPANPVRGPTEPEQLEVAATGEDRTVPDEPDTEGSETQLTAEAQPNCTTNMQFVAPDDFPGTEEQPPKRPGRLSHGGALPR